MTVFRKLFNIPSRVHSHLRQLHYVWSCFLKSYRTYSLIARRIKNSNPSGVKIAGTVVFNAVRAWQTSDLDIYLANLCALRGMTAYVLFDDGVLEHWDSNQIHSSKYPSPYRAPWFIRWPCRIRRYFVWKAYRTGDMRLLNYSDIARRIRIDHVAYEKDESDAISSTKRFFESGLVDIEGEHHDYYAKCLRNCMVSRGIGRYVVEAIKPDLFVTSHGIYSSWGPAHRTVCDAGIPTLVHHYDGTRKGSFRIVDKIQQSLSECSDWREFQDTPSDSSKAAELGARILDERFAYRVADVDEYYPGGRQNQSFGLDSLSDGTRVFGLFPNVVWDGDIPERNIIFESVVDWCVFTIQTIRKTPHHLCIRFHPSEATRMKGSRLLQDILFEKIPDLYEIPNLTMISSSQSVDSYWLVREYIDLGLVYDGTLCLEMTYMGIPVIGCSNGVYSLDDVVFKPFVLDDYLSWLKNPESVLLQFAEDGDTRKAIACQYAHWYFNVLPFTFTPLVSPHNVRMDYSIVHPQESLSPDEQCIWNRLLLAINRGERQHG